MQETAIKREKRTGEASRLSESPKPLRHHNWWQNILSFFLFAILGVLALEAFFNFAGVGNEEFLEPDSMLGVRHIAGKKVVWRLEGFSDDYLSKAGLRDSEHQITRKADTYRIILLGDSATEGLQVELNETYGKILEKQLGLHVPQNKKQLEVINFGCSSYSNGQEMLQLESQAAKYKPDLVVLMYNRGDYIENIRDPRTLKAEARPYFYLDEKGSLKQDNTIMDLNKEHFKKNPLLSCLREKSRIYGVLSHTNLALSLNEGLYIKLRNSVLKLFSANKKQWQKVVDPPYTIKDPWQVTDRLISRVKSDCKSMGSKFMLVCFPNVVNDPEYAKQISQLAEKAKAENFAYLDLTPDYAGTSASKLFLKYHFSAEGHKVAAKRIAASIEQAGK